MRPTDERRLPAVLRNSSGFLYYVSMTGITGVGAPDLAQVAGRVGTLRAKAGLPVAVGFGIRSAEQAGAVAAFADAVVVGSALVEQVANAPDGPAAVAGVLGLVRSLAAGVRSARRTVAAG